MMMVFYFILSKFFFFICLTGNSNFEVCIFVWSRTSLLHKVFKALHSGLWSWILQGSACLQHKTCLPYVYDMAWTQRQNLSGHRLFVPVSTFMTPSVIIPPLRPCCRRPLCRRGLLSTGLWSADQLRADTTD